MSRPKPEEQPVIRTVDMGFLLGAMVPTWVAAVGRANHRSSAFSLAQVQMIDPLAEIVTLLRPSATVSKMVGGAGRWRLRRTDVGQPFYCWVLEGACILTALARRRSPSRRRLCADPGGDRLHVLERRAASGGALHRPVMLASEVRLGCREGAAEVLILVEPLHVRIAGCRPARFAAAAARPGSRRGAARDAWSNWWLRRRERPGRRATWSWPGCWRYC